MSPSPKPRKGISTGATVAIAAAVTALLTTIAYYWRKIILIDEIILRYEAAGGTDVSATREKLWQCNLWELQRIIKST